MVWKALVALMLLTGAVAADSCCAPPHLGVAVAFGDQSNIIVWNPATHTEHFVRQAHFTSRAADFGFIAPTPSKPDLAVVSARAFDDLNDLEPVPPNAGMRTMADATMAAADAPVVIQEQDIGDYHAVTLLASDSAGLINYLKANQYDFSDDVAQWVNYYIKQKWMLTAFKMKKGVDPQSPHIDSDTIRMSFKTDVPFNPYRVPKSNAGEGSLSILFVSDGNYLGSVGGQAWDHAKWDADATPAVAKLASDLKISADDIPAHPRVTKFTEMGWTENPSNYDIEFRPVSPAGPRTTAALVLIGLGGLWLWVRYRSRRPLGTPPAPMA